jgi:uncharacterized protein
MPTGPMPLRPPPVTAVPPAVAAPACRPDCGACCIAPSISTALPGMPEGKPAGVPCVQLDDQRRCRLFGDPRRPAVCASLQPSLEMCGHSASQALVWLAVLEQQTAPALPTAAPRRQPLAGPVGPSAQPA